MEVGGPRADFASFSLDFGGRPAAGPVKTYGNVWEMAKKNNQKSPKNH